MALSAGLQLAGDIAGGLLSSFVGANLMGNSAASQQDRQFSHSWGLMDHQAQLNNAAMRLQNSMNVENYSNRYKWAVDDLRRAGLNPILAATQGVGGNVQGASAVGAGLGSVGLSQVPDYMNGMSSAFQGALSRHVQKKQLELTGRDLDLKELDINSAINKREADIARENLIANVTKWSIEEQNKQQWKKINAEVENLKESLRIQEEHFIRSDQAAFASAEAHAMAASAAWHSAEVQSRLADIADKTGYTQQQLNQAHKLLLEAQTADINSLNEWHEYLNEHKELRGAVGLVGSMWDTYSTAAKLRTMSNAID